MIEVLKRVKNYLSHFIYDQRSSMSFKDYKDSPLMPFVLPIIPVGQPLSPKSKLTPERIGKTPGRWTPEGWVGYVEFTRTRASPEMLDVYDRWFEGAGTEAIVGVLTEEYPFIDNDVEGATWVNEIIDEVVQKHVGVTLTRVRENSTRTALMFRLKKGSMPVKKDKHQFLLPGQEYKEGMKVPEIEFLGKGQQTLIEGMHPSGVSYDWRFGLTPLNSYEQIAEVDADQWNAIRAEIKERLVQRGCNFDIPKAGGTGGRGNTTPDRAPIGPEHFDLAPSLDDLKALLAVFPCTHPDLADRDEWIKFLVAIKTACWGDEGFYDEVVLPWCLEQPDNTEEYVRERWESFEDSALGWNYLLSSTQAENHEGIAKLFADDANWAALEEEDISPPEKPNDRRTNAPIPKLMPADFALHKLPRRQFVLGNRFMMGVVTLGVGPPGTAKSTLAISTALSIATGESLTGERVHRTGRVWIHNNEDSREELYRRIGGTLKYHAIEFDRVREKIFVTSGLDERLVVAVKVKDIVERQKAVAEVISSIRKERIIHIVVDPFVSTHRGVSENSNEEIEQVVDSFRAIAHETGCSVDLIHHSLKPGSRTTDALAGDMNAARGASSLIGAVRMVYTLSPMSVKMAATLNVSEDQAARIVRLDHAKGNYSPRDTRITWFELESFNIGNGDEPDEPFDGDTIAVPKRWKPPSGTDSTQQDRQAEQRDRCQRVRDFVATTMKTDRCKLMEILPEVEKQFVVKTSAARKLLKQAIPENVTALAQANGSTYTLTAERAGQAAPHPITIVRTRVPHSEAQAAYRAHNASASSAPAL